MKKAYIFAIPHKKDDYIIDARNLYNWEEVGTIIFYHNPTEAEVIKARKAHNIPEEAYCVACKLLEV